MSKHRSGRRESLVRASLGLYDHTGHLGKFLKRRIARKERQAQKKFAKESE